MNTILRINLNKIITGDWKNFFPQEIRNNQQKTVSTLHKILEILTTFEKCAVQGKIRTPPTEEIIISWGWQSAKSKHLRKCMKLHEIIIIGISRGMEGA